MWLLYIVGTDLLLDIKPNSNLPVTWHTVSREKWKLIWRKESPYLQKVGSKSKNMAAQSI